MALGGGNGGSAIEKRFKESVAAVKKGASAVGKAVKGKELGSDFVGPRTPKQDAEAKKALKADKARRRAQRGARVGAVQAASSGGSVINRIAPFEASIAGVSSRVKGRRT